MSCKAGLAFEYEIRFWVVLFLVISAAEEGNQRYSQLASMIWFYSR